MELKSAPYEFICVVSKNGDEVLTPSQAWSAFTTMKLGESKQHEVLGLLNMNFEGAASILQVLQLKGFDVRVGNDVTPSSPILVGTYVLMTKVIFGIESFDAT